MAPREKIAMRIKALREQQKISQEELAARAGVSRGYLARLETGRHDPTITMLEKLAKALKVPIGRLLK
jgi:transcriptional regulator with XRE-family HTH domain